MKRKLFLFGIVLSSCVIFASCGAREKTKEELDQVRDTLTIGNVYIRNTINNTYYVGKTVDVTKLPEDHVLMFHGTNPAKTGVRKDSDSK